MTAVGPGKQAGGAPDELPLGAAGAADVAVWAVELRKTFDVPVREAGIRAATKSLVRREMREVAAVDGISFEIAAGEVVGFLGPNGAGKTTTLKMLSGLLYPTSGEARVLGHTPSKRERDFLRRITMVMGNRNQLQWDLPALDSFDLLRAIYRLPRPEFVAMRDELIELLDLGDLVSKPVRNLSLGERMKVEICGALLHRPSVLFLDEPTIGLDVTAQKRIRSFVAEYNQRTGATVLLTSHYMADVQALCKRVIVIHQGRILFDGALASLADQFAATKTIGVTLVEGTPDLSKYGEVMGTEDGRTTLRVARADAPKVTTRLLKDLAVADLTIEDPPIEDVIEHVFASATAVEQPAEEAAPAATDDAPSATDDTPVAGPTP
ncbi:MAG TPA: ATP-binding cassette domain-containing protein [Candidatus Limnocylindrales bacterium]